MPTKKKPRPKTVNQLVAEYQKSLFSILTAAQSLEEQHELLKHMIITFSAIGKEKDLPMTLELATKLVREKFPHLIDDMNKLLLLV